MTKKAKTSSETAELKETTPPQPIATKKTLTTEERLRQQLKSAREENKILLGASAKNDELLELMAENFKSQPEIEMIEYEEHVENGKRSLVLFLSDIHTGQMYDDATGGGLGRYNLKIMQQRAKTLASKVVHIKEDLSRSAPVEHLVIIYGGDHIDGRTIHPGHDHESAGIVDQLRQGPEIMARLLMRPLAKAFNKVDVFAVPGNHGRMGRKGELNRVSDSLDLVFMDILQQRCSPLKNVTWHPWNSWFQWFKLHGHSFFVAHGDAFSSWLGIPFYGAQRYKQKVESLINEPLDVLMVGHHHSPAHWHTAFSNIIMNGSWVGTGNFGAWLGLGGAPTQKLVLVTDEYAAATTYDIILENRQVMLSAKPIVL